MKKKLLLAALSALAVQGASAAYAPIDITSTTAQPIKFASETFGDSSSVVVGQSNTSPLLVTTEAGYGDDVPVLGLSIYIRVEVSNGAVYKVKPVITFNSTTSGADALTPITSVDQTDVTLINGGVNDNVAVFQVDLTAASGTGKLALDDVIGVQISSLSVTEQNTFVTVGLYNTGAHATTDTAVLHEETGPLTAFQPVSTGIFSTSTNAVADSVTGFTTFVTGATNVINSDVAQVGKVDYSLLLPAATTPPTNIYDATDDKLVTASDLATDVSDIQKLTLDGDLTAGSWSMGNSTCAPSSLIPFVVDEDGMSGSIKQFNPATASTQYICVDTEGEKVEKSAYSFTLESADLSANVGTVSYNTDSVDVDYLTTLDAYKQRIIFVNSGAEANYTTTFSAEEGVTSTPGDKAEGVIPANSVLVVKATDLVSFDGGTRGAAMIEIESSDVNVSTQIISDNGSTDTITLD